MTDSTSFKCQVCGNAPDVRQLFQCQRVNTHVMCILCGLKSGRKCQYDNSDMKVASNPSFSSIIDTRPISMAKPCKFKDNGCTWVFATMNEIQSHALECKYRPYQCIGSQLKIWSCDWVGTPETLEDHLKTSHAAQCEFYNYWQNGSVPFVPNQMFKTIKLVQAFNKKFIFYYANDTTRDHVIFAIYLLGRKSDAEKYLIDFEVKQNQRKIKFLDKCHCDTDGDLMTLINEAHCFSISKKNVESFAENGKIEFRFIIKRKDVVDVENSMKEEHSKQNLEKMDKIMEKENSVQNTNLLEALRSKWNSSSDKIVEPIQRSPNQIFNTNSNSYDEYQRDQPILRSNRISHKPKQTLLPAISNIGSNMSNLSLNSGYDDNDSMAMKSFGHRPFNRTFKKNFPPRSNSNNEFTRQ